MPDNYFGLKVADFLERYESRLKEKNTALDIGCANGANARYLADFGLKVIGLDVELPKNIEPYKNVIWLKEDILDFDFNQKFDVIVAFNILQFLDIGNRSKILDKMYNSLNPDGLIMIKSFTQKDPSYLKGKKMGQFAENELLEWAECKEMHISEYQEKEIEDFHQPIGKHTHGIVYFAGSKEG